MRIPTFRESWLTSGALLLAAICWGLAPVATRYLLNSFTPLELIVLRFTSAALLLLLLLPAIRKTHWTLRKAGQVLFCGVTGVIGYNLLVTYGLRTVPAGIAGLLIATEPIWILIIAALVLREKIARSVWIGLAFSFSGIVLLIGVQGTNNTLDNTFLTGALLVVLAALMWSIYTVSVRSLSKELGSRSSTALTMVVGTLPLLPLWDNHSWPILLHLNTPAWLALALLVLGSTVAATILWNYAVAHTASSRAGLFLYLVPLISVIGGTIFLHEQISAVTLISGLLIIIGIVIAQQPHAQ